MCPDHTSKVADVLTQMLMTGGWGVVCAGEREGVVCAGEREGVVCSIESSLHCSEDPAELDSVKKALTSTLKKNTKGGDRPFCWLPSPCHLGSHAHTCP